MNRATTFCAILAAFIALPALRAEESPKKDEGWTTLFDGKTLEGWMDRAGKAPSDKWIVEDGALTRAAGAGDIWTKERFGDFVLELEFKTAGNSGVFIRTDDPKNNV